MKPTYNVPILKKLKASKLFKDYTLSKECNLIEKCVELDPTDPKFVYEYLCKQKEINQDLKIKFYDTLSTEDLLKLNIDKKMNNKDIFYYIINYFENVNILFRNKISGKYQIYNNEDNLEEVEESEENLEEDEDKEKEKKNEIIINKNITMETNAKKKEELDIKKIFPIGEEIKLNDLKIKMINFYDIFFCYFNYKRINPSFGTEYFYYILIKYIFNTFESLYNSEFLSKVSLIKNLERVTLKIKNNEISDNILTMYYFFVITEEYKIEDRILDLLQDLGENTLSNFIYQDYSIINDLNTNQLLIKQNEKTILTIDNSDHYRLYPNDIIDFIKKKKFYSYSAIYSIKGYLLNYEIDKLTGDKYWEEFLSSKIAEEIMKIYYGKFDCKIFKEKEVIDMFKNNSFYHPIFNSAFNALTQKELFFFYFSSDINTINNTNILRKCKALCKLPKFSFFKTTIHHEFFHGAQAYLFFIFPENNVFDSHKRDLTNIKINMNKNINQNLVENIEKNDKNISNKYISNNNKNGNDKNISINEKKFNNNDSNNNKINNINIFTLNLKIG